MASLTLSKCFRKIENTKRRNDEGWIYLHVSPAAPVSTTGCSVLCHMRVDDRDAPPPALEYHHGFAAAQASSHSRKRTGAKKSSTA